jgi:hypothetical protein
MLSVLIVHRNASMSTRRNRYPLSLKREVVKKAKELLNQGISLRKTAKYFGEHRNLHLSAIQLSTWLKSEAKMNLSNAASGLPKSGNALSLHPGKLSIVQRVNDLGVEVQHIPGGCTGVCQPVDVGIGKPLKNRITNCWEDWMVEHGGLDDEKTKTPSREDVSRWVIKSIGSIGPKLVRNSWRRNGFSYFPSEPEEFVPGVDESLEVTDEEIEHLENLPDDDDDDSLIDTLIFRTNSVLGCDENIAVSPENMEENMKDTEDTMDYDDN